MYIIILITLQCGNSVIAYLSVACLHLWILRIKIFEPSFVKSIERSEFKKEIVIFENCMDMKYHG